MADTISYQITNLVRNIDQNVNYGKGMATAFLKDSGMVVRMESSLENIQKGTAAFNENMEALKSSFLFRGYFRRLEQQKKKEAEGIKK